MTKTKRKRISPRIKALEAEREKLRDLAEWAWGVIANVCGGNWKREDVRWVSAAESWRENYHRLVIDARRTQVDK